MVINMIKQLSRKKNKRKVILVSAAGILVLVGLFCALELTNAIDIIHKSSNDSTASSTKQNVNDVNYNPPTSEEVDLGNQIKSDAQQSATSGSNTNGALSVSFSSSTQDEKGGPIIVRTIVSASEGDCTIKLSGANFSQTFSTTIKDLGTYSGCNLDIPVDTISAGSYTITLTAKTTTATASIVQQVEVRK